MSPVRLSHPASYGLKDTITLMLKRGYHIDHITPEIQHHGSHTALEEVVEVKFYKLHQRHTPLDSVFFGPESIYASRSEDDPETKD